MSQANTIPSWRKFVSLHKSLRQDQQRAGQRFYNLYIKKDDETTKSMFYEADEQKALQMIFEWLCANQHITELPPVYERTCQTAIHQKGLPRKAAATV